MVKLDNDELNKIAKGLLQIQHMAFYGYNNGDDNQEQIDLKAREILSFINSKVADEGTLYMISKK